MSLLLGTSISNPFSLPMISHAIQDEVRRIKECSGGKRGNGRGGKSWFQQDLSPQSPFSGSIVKANWKWKSSLQANYWPSQNNTGFLNQLSALCKKKYDVHQLKWREWGAITYALKNLSSFSVINSTLFDLIWLFGLPTLRVPRGSVLCLPFPELVDINSLCSRCSSTSYTPHVGRNK